MSSIQPPAGRAGGGPMSTFPNDAERGALPCTRRCQERDPDLYGHTAICEEERNDILAVLAPLVAAREAAAEKRGRVAGLREAADDIPPGSYVGPGWLEDRAYAEEGSDDQ